MDICKCKLGGHNGGEVQGSIVKGEGRGFRCVVCKKCFFYYG